jgi:DNA-binding response OmpR family regulator
MVQQSILIVDDELLIARELEARLQSKGYRVSGIAPSGPEAIRLADETRPDLVLMDIALSGSMDGIEAYGEIRRRHRVPVIYLTAYADNTVLDRAKITEPFAFILKPFSERELSANIELAFHKHKSEMKLQATTMWFTEAMKRTTDGVIATSGKHGAISFINQSAERLTRWTSQEALGKPLEEVFIVVHGGEPGMIPRSAY